MKWIIIISIISMMIVLSGCQYLSSGSLVTLENGCVSSEPLNSQEYSIYFNKLVSRGISTDTNVCTAIDVSHITGIYCNYQGRIINVFMADMPHLCNNVELLTSNYSLVSTHLGQKIYYPKVQTAEPATSFYYMCSKSGLVIQASSQELLTSYIDDYSTCQTPLLRHPECSTNEECRQLNKGCSWRCEGRRCVQLTTMSLSPCPYGWLNYPDCKCASSCTSNYQCPDYNSSQCINNVKTRVCTDLNNCQSDKTETISCSLIYIEDKTFMQKYGIIIGIILLGGIFIYLINKK